MIGKWTDRYSEINSARQLISWVELYYLKSGKRSVSWENMEFNPHLNVWIFSAQSGVYFLMENVEDNPGIRRKIASGNAFLVFNAAHDYNVKEGMRIVGQKYGIEEIDYHLQYIPLVEALLALDSQDGLSKGERSQAEIAVQKAIIHKIIGK